MWIILNNAMLSLVQNRKRPETVLVRSRLPEDINRVFPEAVVWETLDADYRYRTVVSKEEAGAKVAEKIEQIDYSNFKDSVNEEDRHEVYMNVWGDLHALQPDTRRHTLPPCALVMLEGGETRVMYLHDAMAANHKIVSKNPSDFI